MEKSIKLLIERFEEIRNKGWIKTKFNGPGSIGNNFEFLIGKDIDNFPIPDFNGIEIKTKQNNIKQEYISLFTCIPYGKDFFEIQRLKNAYGYPDKEFKNYNVLNGDVFCKYKRKIGKNYYFNLEINKNSNKIKLLIFDNYYNLIDDYAYWDLKEIEDKIMQKLEYLAVVGANKRVYQGKTYFKYTNLNIYKIKNFKTFLRLLSQAKIKIQFRIGVFKKGPRFGQTHDRGTVFAIKTKYLNELFEKIY